LHSQSTVSPTQMFSPRQLLLASAFLTCLSGAILGNLGWLHQDVSMFFCGYFPCQILGLAQLALVERAWQR